MSYELVGKLLKKYDTVKKSETFQTRDFVVENSPSGYTQYIKFQLTQDRCGLIDTFEEGQEIKVFFDIRGNKWTDPTSGEDRFFTNLNAWKFENPAQQAAPMAQQSSAPAETTTPLDDPLPKMEEDDLPF